MGAEAYGLIGFFAMMQAWFNILDLGLTATIARESARYRGGALSCIEYRRLTRTLELMFSIVALVGGGLLVALAGTIARQWLNANEVAVSEVTHALRMIAIIVALRWMCGLYRGIITGAEQLVWLSGFNILIATIRFVLVLPMLMLVSATPRAFFAFQLGVAAFELVGLVFIAYRILPRIPAGEHIFWHFASFRPVFKFALSVAFSSVIWVLVSQVDKLILSKYLSLKDYGIFTLAVVAAGGLMLISGPIGQALMPRLSKLSSERKDLELVETYRKSTQWISMVVAPITLCLAFFSKDILWIWTGDIELSIQASGILSLYAIGNGIMTISAFSYYLQYAKGDLKLHTIGNLIILLIMVPTLLYATLTFGALGAAWVWAILHILYFIIWTPLVHRKFYKGLHAKWMWGDILKFFALPVATILMMPDDFFSFDSRLVSFSLIFIFTALMIISNLLLLSCVREKIKILYYKFN